MMQMMCCNPKMMKCMMKCPDMMKMMCCKPEMMKCMMQCCCNPDMMKCMKKMMMMCCEKGSCDMGMMGMEGDGMKCTKKRCPIPKDAKRAFALAEKFGGEPEKYRQFVEETKGKDFCDVMCLWKKNHKECEEACMKSCAAKLAYICKESTDKMMECVKANPDMRFKQLLMKCCKERGIKLDCYDHDDDMHSDNCSDDDMDNRHTKRMGDKSWRGMRDWKNEDNDTYERKQEPKQTPTETPKTTPLPPADNKPKQ